MPRIIRPSQNGQGRRFAIAASLFNEDIVRNLVDGAVRTLLANGVADDDITVAWVPGAFELPLAAQMFANTGRYSAVLCLGAIIKGETRHDEVVGDAAARGVAEVSRDTGVPCLFGVITAGNRQQALDRSGPEVNRGAEAAEAALEMADLLPGIE
ncbi:MAG: 6,7-dimethyl-8-ribityllumazine synthase [Planctomycetia bacterium]|nr:6,7-dimethyl-8-ribityllumazine synthase [Planctomycetia bacterium]